MENSGKKKLHERKKVLVEAHSGYGCVIVGDRVAWNLGVYGKNEKNLRGCCSPGVEPGGVFARLVLPDGKNWPELNKDSNNLFLGESAKVLRNENGVLFF